MEAVAAQADARLIRYARQRFPDHFGDAPSIDIGVFVADVRSRARQHQIVEEPDVATALDLTVMYGPGFYSAEWARDVFAMESWTGHRKLELIRQRVNRQVVVF